tara:strand:+ start:508 stop:825 length:318 start_codon:yes stop_codon:yes gene_type:complete
MIMPNHDSVLSIIKAHFPQEEQSLAAITCMVGIDRLGKIIDVKMLESLSPSRRPAFVAEAVIVMGKCLKVVLHELNKKEETVKCKPPQSASTQGRSDMNLPDPQG